MVRQTPTEQITTIYTYNEKDQLETEVQTVLQADGGSYAATPTPKPKRSAGITLAAIASISFTGLLIPFLLLRTSTGGKRARRNRRFIAAVSAFFIPLMAVDPATVCALQNESLAYQALVAAGAANIDPDTTIVEYLYDSNGNTIEKTTSGQAGNSTTTYTYDSENRLIKLDKNLGPQSITTYTYDTEGIRTIQQTGTERIVYTVDKNRPYAQVLEERDESNQLTKRYTYGHDLISQTTNPNHAEESIKYFHYDGQMSTRTLTEGSPTRSMFRQVTDTYTYDAFGNTITQTGSTDNQYKYTGEQFDAELKQYYLRTRYYDQSIGRFTYRDTFDGFENAPQSLNRYIYANANPIDNRDPSGLFAIPHSLAYIIRGILAESFIQGYYALERGIPADGRIFNVTVWGGGLLGFTPGYPDILDSRSSYNEIYEIKPWRGVAAGIAQIARYMIAIYDSRYSDDNLHHWGVYPKMKWPGSYRLMSWPYGGMIGFHNAAPGVIIYEIVGDEMVDYNWDMVRRRRAIRQPNKNPFSWLMPAPALMPVLAIAVAGCMLARLAPALPKLTMAGVYSRLGIGGFLATKGIH